MNKNNRLSNEIVDERLKDRNIIRLDNFITTKVKIHFQCTKCSHIWLALPCQILFGSGCGNCYGRFKLSNTDIDNRLENSNILRIGDYVNARTKVKLQCKICSYKWRSRPDIFLTQQTLRKSKVKSGCPKCNGKLHLSNKDIDKKLLKTNIMRMDNYINADTPINFKCLICNKNWKTRPSNILNKHTGCPACKYSKNEKLIYKLLINSKIHFKAQRILKIAYPHIKQNIRVDFFIYNKNLIIEYNGLQHYEPVRFNKMSIEYMNIKFEKQKLRDKYLAKFCKENAINLLWIDGRKYYGKKLEKYIIDELIPSLK